MPTFVTKLLLVAGWSEFMWACHNEHNDAEANFDF